MGHQTSTQNRTFCMWWNGRSNLQKLCDAIMTPNLRNGSSTLFNLSHKKIKMVLKAKADPTE